MNLEDIYMKAQWCDELLKEINDIKETNYPDLYIDTGSKLNESLLVLEKVKKDLKCKKETLKERFDKAFYSIYDDLVQIGQRALKEVEQKREQRNKETIENAKEWYEITCPSCGKTYKCTYQDSGTHCYNYITEDGIEIVDTIECGELECPNCHEWYKEEKWNFKEIK